MPSKENEFGAVCHLLPDLHIIPKHLTKCTPLNVNSSDRYATVYIRLTIPKQHTFHVSLSGMRLNCSPVGGIVMSTISAYGDTMRCKSLLGSDEGGLVTCPYQCKCPDVCSKVVAYINNKVGTSLCKIREWNISTVAQFLCWCQVYSWEPIELHPSSQNAIVIKKVILTCYRHQMASHLVSIEVVTWPQSQGHRSYAIVQRCGCVWLHTFKGDEKCICLTHMSAVVCRSNLILRQHNDSHFQF